MRILIGLTEIANIAYTYSKGFRALGHETTVILANKNRFFPDSKYEIIINPHDNRTNAGRSIKDYCLYVWHLLKKFYYLVWALPRFDIFVFIFGSSFLPLNLDFLLIKLFKKKIVSTFWGSEIRYAPELRKELVRLGIDADFQPLIQYLDLMPRKYLEKLLRVKAAELFSDLILSQQGYGQLQKRPYMRANVPIDLNGYEFKIPGHSVPIVVHAPSRREIKGTDIILNAVKQLKEEGLIFEFRLVENMSNSEVRRILTESDIVVDELYSETIGVLSTEAMASGDATLVHYVPDYAHISSDCPAVNVTKDTLVSRLREVILNNEQRVRLAYAGRTYVEKNNDHLKVVQQILDWLEPEGITHYEYEPTSSNVYAK